MLFHEVRTKGTPKLVPCCHSKHQKWLQECVVQCEVWTFKRKRYGAHWIYTFVWKIYWNAHVSADVMSHKIGEALLVRWESHARILLDLNTLIEPRPCWVYGKLSELPCEHPEKCSCIYSMLVCLLRKVTFVVFCVRVWWKGCVVWSCPLLSWKTQKKIANTLRTDCALEGALFGNTGPKQVTHAHVTHLINTIPLAL